MALYPPYDENDPKGKGPTAIPTETAPVTASEVPATAETAPPAPIAAPDGPNASMMPAGMSMQTGQPPQPTQKIEPNDLKQLDVFRNPEALSEIAQAYLKNGSSTGLQWLNHVHSALKENAGEAIQNLIAGNGDAAVKAFNKSGMYQDAKSAVDNGDGTWTLTRENGQSIVVDPQKAAAALLSPAEYTKQQSAVALAAAQSRHLDAAANYSNSRPEFNQLKLESDRQRDADKMAANIEANRVRGESAATIRAIQADKDKADRALNDRTDPTLTFNELAKSFSNNPEPGIPPEISAIRVTSRSPATKPMMDPNTGQVHIVNRKTGEPIFSFKDIDAAKAALPGLYIPSGQGAPAKSAPAANKPTTVAPVAPPLPAPATAEQARLNEAAKNRATDARGMMHGLSLAMPWLRKNSDQPGPQ